MASISDGRNNNHTHTFNGPFSGTTRVSRYQKGENQSGFCWSKRQWVAMASAGPYASLHLAPTDNHASSPQLSFLQARCPSCRPTNSVKALKAQEQSFCEIWNGKVTIRAYLQSASCLMPSCTIPFVFPCKNRFLRLTWSLSSVERNGLTIAVGVNYLPVTVGVDARHWQYCQQPTEILHCTSFVKVLLYPTSQRCRAHRTPEASDVNNNGRDTFPVSSPKWWRSGEPCHRSRLTHY